MLIREATTTDIKDIFRIQRAVSENRMDRKMLELFGITSDSLARILTIDGKGWMASVHGRSAGFSLVSIPQRELAGLYVLPKFEGIGIGTCLMQTAMDWLWHQGITEVTIDTDDNADTRANFLYQRFGAIRTTPAHVGHWRYLLRLPAQKSRKIKGKTQRSGMNTTLALGRQDL